MSEFCAASPNSSDKEVVTNANGLMTPNRMHIVFDTLACPNASQFLL
jgi:hypothetical protein